MKKILGLMIAFMLTVGLVTGGAWAFSTDVATSSGNILTAGTLDLSPSTTGSGPAGKFTITAGGSGANGNVTFQKLLPGDSGNITWLLTNNGTIPGSLIFSSNVTFAENGSNEVETAVSGNDHAGSGDLDIYMGVKLQRGMGSNQANATANLTYILGTAANYVPFSGLQAVLNSQNITMAAVGGNNTAVYQFSWSLGNPLKGAGVDGLFGTGDDTAVNDNVIQSDSAQIDITFTLNQ